MMNLTEKAFSKFAYITGIIGEIREYEQFGKMCLMVLAFLALLAGFKIYRMFFSTFTFMFIATSFCLVLEPLMDWGAVVTYFSVIGTVVAALAYRWNKLGGFVVCMLVSGSMGFILSPSFIAVISSLSIACLLMYFFPFYTLCCYTSIWGAWVMWEMLPQLKSPLSAIVLFICGFSFQIYLNRKQTELPKIYSDKLVYWLEKKERHLNVKSFQKRNKIFNTLGTFL